MRPSDKGNSDMMRLVKSGVSVAAIALALSLSSSAYAADCGQLAAARVNLGGLLQKIKSTAVQPFAGLQAAIAEVKKLDLSREKAEKLETLTGPIVKAGVVTVEQVQALCAEADKDIAAEAAAKKCQ